MKIPWLIPMLVVVTMTTLALAQADDSNPNRSDQGSEDTLVVAPPGSSPKIPKSLVKFLDKSLAVWEIERIHPNFV